MDQILVDGLGYDTAKELYFTVTYAWKYLIPNQKKSNTTIGKSGITKYDVKTAMAEAAPTRGKQFHQEALWGYECDRKYLPKDITAEQANKIVQTMDNLFKESMDDWTLRNKKQSKEIGTEFYEGPSNIWLETIKEEWANAFYGSIKIVLGLDYNFDITQIQAMGSQGDVTKQIGECLEENNKVRAIIPCGYGKGFVMWYGIHRWEQFKNKKFIFYFCHNIPATKQLAVKHSQYAGGNDGFKRIVVCSEKKYVNGQVKYGIENYTASESKLDEILIETFKSPEKVVFYVNNKSAGEFIRKFKTLSKKIGGSTKSSSIIDESQEFTGHKDLDKCDAVIHSISDYQVSFTATERRRGTDTNQDRIYNNDLEYFGVIATEITVSQTISEGRSCPIHFKTVEVSDDNPILTEIRSNNIVETIFEVYTEDEVLSIRGRILRAAVCLVKSIKDDERTHPLVVTSLIKDTESFIRLIKQLKIFGVIPQDYEIVRALREDGLPSAVSFNEKDKAILIGTPWLITGIDAPNTDAFIPVYDMGSEITATQGIGRGQRPVDGKNLIVYIPVNPNSREITTMLRVANKFINDENVHVEAMETNTEENPESIFGSVQRRNITSEIDRDINADASLKVYWNKVYQDLTSSEIGSINEYSRLISFEEARDFVRKLNLRTQLEFYDWKKNSDDRTIPYVPNRQYLLQWLSWADFLGTKPGWKGEYRPFEEARDFVWSLNLKTQDEWQKYSKSGQRPFDIPSNPKKVYGDEYLSFYDWLGTKKGFSKWKTLDELSQFAKSVGINSSKEWIDYWKKNEKPNDIPLYLSNSYPVEWKGWNSFLGKEEKQNFVSYQEAENFAKTLNLSKMSEWFEWCKRANRPSNIPTNPQNIYKDKGWESWGVFLGTGVVADVKKIFLSYEEAKKVVKMLNLKNAKEWKKYSASDKRPTNIPAGPNEYYKKNNEWKGWGDWLGNNKVSNKNKFDEKTINEILLLLKQGVTQVEIAKKYDIGRSKLNELNKSLKKQLN